MKYFAKIPGHFQLLTIFAQSSIIKVLQSSEYVTGYPAGIHRSKLAIETLEQGVKYVQSEQ